MKTYMVKMIDFISVYVLTSIIITFINTTISFIIMTKTFKNSDKIFLYQLKEDKLKLKIAEEKSKEKEK